MKVLDAGVVVELLIGRIEPSRLGASSWAVPHLIDSEVTNALRNLVARELLTPSEGDTVMNGFVALHLSRYAVDGLRDRMWELRNNLTAYDATYVALAEALGPVALVTTDARLAASPGISCPVELV